MEIERIKGDFTVCKVADYAQVNLESEYCFIGKTEEEKSLVCLTEDVPAGTAAREDGWRAFRIAGILDFSLTGILAEIASLLAEGNIGIFAVSTFHTDYIFVKKEHEMEALSRLAGAGHKILTGDAYGDYFMNRTAQDVMAEYCEQHEEWERIDQKR